MHRTSVEKDELYYSDLGYVIRKYAGMLPNRDRSIERRIFERCHSVDVVVNGVSGSVISEFQLEVFSVIEKIIEEARVNRVGFTVISNYPDLVNNALTDIESKKANVKKK